MSTYAYNSQSAGDLITSSKFNEVTAALGRVTDVGLHPDVLADYVLWRSGATYYAKNSHTGAVTSNAACHTLANGLLATDKWLHFKGGSADYVLTGAIDFANYTDAVITGNPRRGTVFTPADTVNAFEFDENWWCVLDGFKIDGSNQATSGMGLKFTEATGTNYAKRNVIKNIDFSGCYQGIGDLGTTTNEGANNIFEDLNFFDSVVRDVAISAANTGGWNFSRCHSDHIAVQATGNYLFQFSGIHGLGLVGCSWLTGGASSKSTMLIEDTSFLTMDRCDAEKAGQNIFTFDNVDIANLTNIRAAEAGMDAGGSDANVEMAGCRDFNVSNFFFGTTTGLFGYVLDIGPAVGPVESTRLRFTNGSISSGYYGLGVRGANTTYVTLQNTDFHSNSTSDVRLNNNCEYVTLKGNRYLSGGTWSLTGDKHTYDQSVRAGASLDLSGGATDIDVFFAHIPCVLASYRLFYTEASSGDAGVTVEIGRYQDGVALDDDYFDQSTSEINKALGYSKLTTVGGLTQHVIAAGDTVTVGTAGGKAGTGEVRVVLDIIENAS